MSEPDGTRQHEWYVPSFGPRRFRLFVGMSFFPYTLMNACYVLVGSLIAPSVDIYRMAGMAVVYLLAVGVSAHSLDAMAPNRPWGGFLSRRQMTVLALGGLIPACAIGLYYAFTTALLLLPIGVLELFFLLSYNLELLGGRFHTDFWFAFSWGFLPVLAGYAVQTDALSAPSIAAGLFGFSTAYVEINASRPYKDLKREPGGRDSALATRLEAILKGVVASVLVTALFLLLRLAFG